MVIGNANMLWSRQHHKQPRRGSSSFNSPYWSSREPMWFNVMGDLSTWPNKSGGTKATIKPCGWWLSYLKQRDVGDGEPQSVDLGQALLVREGGHVLAQLLERAIDAHHPLALTDVCRCALKTIRTEMSNGYKYLVLKKTISKSNSSYARYFKVCLCCLQLSTFYLFIVFIW